MFSKRFNLEQLSGGIIVPLFILLLGAGIYFILLPQYRELSSLRDLKESKAAAFEGRKASLSGVQSLVKNLEQARPNLQIIEEALPTAPRIPELLANFDYLAGQSGITISSMELAPAPTLKTAGAGVGTEQIQELQKLRDSATNLGIMQAQLSLLGAYPNIKSFILNLEQNLRLMDIGELIFAEVDPESGLQEYALKINIYYQQE